MVKVTLGSTGITVNKNGFGALLFTLLYIIFIMNIQP
jgi:hypothetical protein